METWNLSLGLKFGFQVYCAVHEVGIQQSGVGYAYEGFPKLEDFFGVSITRTVVYWGLY